MSAENQRGTPDTHHDAAPFAPAISTDDIFSLLIEEELRAGRLTPARRRRIIRYAAQLQLSPAQVGRMIEAARRRALEDEDQVVRRHALRLVHPPKDRLPLPWKLTLIVTAVILVDVLIVLAF